MPTTTDRSSLPVQRGENPFRGVPMPIPLDGYNLRASEIFRDRPLAARLCMNAEWLQARSRTSDEIEAALFPDYSLTGMDQNEVRSQLNHAIYAAGFAPSDREGDNPTWTWTEGK